jgi:hypothetical protein
MTLTEQVYRIKPLGGWAEVETKSVRGFVCQPEPFSFYAGVYQSREAEGWSSQWKLTLFANGESQADKTPIASPEEGKALADVHWREFIEQALEKISD